MYKPVRPERQQAFAEMFDALQEGFAELLANGWDPSKAREVIERELGPYTDRRRQAA